MLRRLARADVLRQEVLDRVPAPARDVLGAELHPLVLGRTKTRDAQKAAVLRLGDRRVELEKRCIGLRETLYSQHAWKPDGGGDRTPGLRCTGVGKADARYGGLLVL